MRYMKPFISVALIFTILMFCVGCRQTSEEPVTVTLWHVYGAQTDSPLNNLIDEFNHTVGKQQNIYVKVTSVTNNKTIHEGVLAAAFDDPGAPELPDMFVSYPKTVLAMPDDKVLVDYNDYFSEEELGEFLPTFIEEGIVNDRLVVLPIAKSTEILYVNKTAFDRFSAETGAQLSDLQTWEGLFALAEKYVQWTDALTPDTPNDGKAFFVHDFHFNYFQVGVESLRGDFLRRIPFPLIKPTKRYGNHMRELQFRAACGWRMVMLPSLCVPVMPSCRSLHQQACCIFPIRLHMPTTPARRLKSSLCRSLPLKAVKRKSCKEAPEFARSNPRRNMKKPA